MANILKSGQNKRPWSNQCASILELSWTLKVNIFFYFSVALSYINAFSRNSLERIHLALDCRHSLQESTVSLEYAQKSLSHVEFAHVSARQVSAVQHANVYLLTDMSNASRFQHTRNVLESYQHNVSKSLNWLHDTFRKTIKANLSEAEGTVHLIAMQLRKERLNYIDGTTLGGTTFVPSGENELKYVPFK